jgi:hypothetical protein
LFFGIHIIYILLENPLLGKVEQIHFWKKVEQNINKNLNKNTPTQGTAFRGQFCPTFPKSWKVGKLESWKVGTDFNPSL